jgi:heme exporter protein CcmD
MSDQHWLFVALAYGVTIVAIGGIAGNIILDYRRLRTELARFDGAAQQRGVAERRP